MIASHSPSSPDRARTESAIASDGRASQPLRLQPDANGAPVLVDDAGRPFAPSEIERPLRPASAEAAVRRGGHVIDRYPDPSEPWCNCAD